MIRFLAKRLGSGLLILFSVVTVVFFLFSFSFPNPESMAVGQRTDQATQEAIKKEFGLDQPLGMQYLLFLNDISPLSFHKNSSSSDLSEKYGKCVKLSFDRLTILIKTPFLRRSFQSRERTDTLIFQSFKGTFILALVSIIFAAFFGILLGVLSGIKANSFADQAIVFVSTLGISVPSFFSAIILAWLFGFVFHHITGLNMTGSWIDIDPFVGEYYQWKNLILPAIALGVRPLSIFTLLTRSSMLETLNKDFIKTAKSKGLTAKQILNKHALPNALNPVITAVSGWFASLLAGAFFVEYIFNWRGLGKLTIEALEMNDLPVVMGAILFIAFLFVVINIIVDILYVKLDPRIKLS
ncbi:MAG: ABC transporter permease [Bacteroidetes bacterium]|jgi:peptide/nickel transport system permease protein|nr:ABC transporter permease [Bacteroidota bacterium]MDA8930160.1 ABC transporter permease [Bacteroidia bacterium]